MTYPVVILIVAAAVFLVGSIFNVPKFILVPVTIILGGYGIYELAFGRKDDEARRRAKIEAVRLKKEKEEAEKRQRQREEEDRRKKELAEQEKRWTALFNQMKADHQAEMNRLMERISSISDERMNRISVQINELAQKYSKASIISNLSEAEIEAEVKKREAQIRAESQEILNKAISDAEAKHKNQLVAVQSAIREKYDELLHEKEKAFRFDLDRQTQEVEKVRQDMKHEQDLMAAQLNEQHKLELDKVQRKVDAEQRQAIDAVKAELDKTRREKDQIEKAKEQAEKEKDKIEKDNEKLQAERDRLQKELENRLSNMEKRGECQHYQDRQIYDLLIRLIGQVKYRMDIICPWASHGVVNEKFLKKIAKMADRDVELYIRYGYSEKDDRAAETEKCLKKLEAVYRERGKADKVNIRFGKTHEKIIMCDDDLYFSTSCNVLSNPVVNGTGEGGILFHDKKSVDYRRKKDFSYSGTIYFTDIGKPKD